MTLRADFGPAREPVEVHGREATLERARFYSDRALHGRLVLVNGLPGMVTLDPDGGTFSLGAVSVRDGRIAEIDFLGDPERLARLDLSWLR